MSKKISNYIINYSGVITNKKYPKIPPSIYDSSDHQTTNNIMLLICEKIIIMHIKKNNRNQEYLGRRDIQNKWTEDNQQKLEDFLKIYRQVHSFITH